MERLMKQSRTRRHDLLEEWIRPTQRACADAMALSIFHRDGNPEMAKLWKQVSTHMRNAEAIIHLIEQLEETQALNATAVHNEE
jgi:hypothetical protein